MPRLILILAVAAVVYILLRRVAAMPPHQRRGEYMKLGFGVAIVAVILLTLAGKMHWIGAALTGALVFIRQSLPLLMRYVPMLASLRSNKGSASQQSTVSSAILKMHLDHETGALSGVVIEGPFRDWRLDEMSRDQLEELRAYCRTQDSESLQLLEGYLEQRFADAGGQNDSDSDSATTESKDGMSRREAFEILGLEEEADHDAIVTAHRQLMQKLHPDRGGSDYLAAKINQAKDLLLQNAA